MCLSVGAPERAVLGMYVDTVICRCGVLPQSTTLGWGNQRAAVYMGF